MHTEENKQKQVKMQLKLILSRDDDILPYEELDQYGMDSINFINLIVELEKIFAIEFEDDKLLFDNFSTIQKIVERIENELIP